MYGLKGHPRKGKARRLCLIGSADTRALRIKIEQGLISPALERGKAVLLFSKVPFMILNKEKSESGSKRKKQNRIRRLLKKILLPLFAF